MLPVSFWISSRQLFFWPPTFRVYSRGVQIVAQNVHLLWFIRLMWPAHVHRRLFPYRKRSLSFETVVAISQNGRCHLKRSMPFFSSELHSLGLRTQKVAVDGSCVSLVIWVRVRVKVLFRVRAKNPSSSLEIFGLFFSSSFSFINVFFPLFS